MAPRAISLVNGVTFANDLPFVLVGGMNVIEGRDILLDVAAHFVEVAEPVGIIAGVTPVTNPTSTTMFKALIAAKTRNPIIFAFHPSAQKCSAESARVTE